VAPAEEQSAVGPFLLRMSPECGSLLEAAPLLEPVSRTVVFNCWSFLSGRPIPRSQAEVTMLLPGGYPGPQSPASPTKTNGTARRPSSSSPRAPTPIAAMHAMSASRLDIGTSLSALKRTLKKNSQGAMRQSDVEYQFVTNERMELHFDVIHRTGPSYACPAGELPREIFQLARAAAPTRSWAMVACLCTAPFATRRRHCRRSPARGQRTGIRGYDSEFEAEIRMCPPNFGPKARRG